MLHGFFIFLYISCFQAALVYFGRLGQVENARRHIFTCQQPDASELLKLQAVEMHLMRCADARKIGDWKSALREGDAAIVAGADSSPQVKLQYKFLSPKFLYPASYLEKVNNNGTIWFKFVALCISGGIPAQASSTRRGRFGPIKYTQICSIFAILLADKVLWNTLWFLPILCPSPSWDGTGKVSWAIYS